MSGIPFVSMANLVVFVGKGFVSTLIFIYISSLKVAALTHMNSCWMSSPSMENLGTRLERLTREETVVQQPR
jgi:hypothetical protein